jgi:hypothetical protein
MVRQDCGAPQVFCERSDVNKWLWLGTAVALLLWSLGHAFAYGVMDWVLAMWPAQGLPVPEQVQLPVWLQLWFSQELLNSWLAFWHAAFDAVRPWLPAPESWHALLRGLLLVSWVLGAVLLIAGTLVLRVWLTRRSAGRARFP